jgi:hypothetical protein
MVAESLLLLRSPFVLLMQGAWELAADLWQKVVSTFETGGGPTDAQAALLVQEAYLLVRVSRVGCRGAADRII